MNKHNWIAILDFGSQYSQLIARRIREQRVYSELLRFDTSAKILAARKPAGIILSGGPASILDDNAPMCDPVLFDLGIPVLGICYGMQMTAKLLCGTVKPGRTGEYGHAKIFPLNKTPLFKDLPSPIEVWMSHGDQVESMPPGFHVLAKTGSCPVAAMAHPGKHIFGLQFHPEVVHTPQGTEILRQFIFDVCACTADWEMARFATESIAAIRKRVGSGRVICGLSGGVDSSVVAALLHKAVGNNLHCIFVDNGLLRHREAEQVEKTFGRAFRFNLKIVDASENFFRN